MITFKEFYLTEATQALYHATYISNIKGMLESNSIKLTISTGADSEVNRNKYYYLSAARVKYGRYALISTYNKNIGYHVVIDLNGQAISSVAQIKSVDYWGKEFQKVSSYREEQEERILSDKSELKPLNKYVNGIHIYIGDNLSNDKYKSELLYINDRAKELNVNVYFYTKGNEQAFKSQQIKKSITDLHSIIDKNKLDKDKYEKKYVIVYIEKDGTKHYDNRLKTKFDAENDLQYWGKETNAKVVSIDDLDKEGLKYEPKKSYYEKDLIDFMNVYFGKKPISKSKYDVLNRFVWSFEGKTLLANAIQGVKKEHPEILSVIVNEMKKLKIKQVSEFFKYAIDKIYEREKDKD